MEEYDDIFEARRIVNGIKLDLMIEDDNSNIVINSIQEHQEKNDNGQTTACNRE